MKLEEYIESHLDAGEICAIVKEADFVGHYICCYYICLVKGSIVPVISPTYLNQEVVNVEHSYVDVLKNKRDGSKTSVNVTIITVKDLAVSEHTPSHIYEQRRQQPERSFQMED